MNTLEANSRAGMFFPFWALVLPISSVLVLPGLQGTTPGNVCAFLLLTPAVAALTLGFSGARDLYRNLAKRIMIFVSLNAIAQLGLVTFDFPGFGAAQLVDPFDRNIALRGTLFTQSLYLLAAAITFAFVQIAYRSAWDRWILAGAVLLASYGIYEIVWFAVTRTPGDFLSNRFFGSVTNGYFAGSAFQIFQAGPITMQRLKSLTGEPSMYAFTVLPFWIYAVHTGRRFVHWLLFATLVLTMSTTAFLGIALYLLLRLWFFRGKDKIVVVLVVAAALVALGAIAAGINGNPAVLELYSKIFADKLSGQDYGSGQGRLKMFTNAMNLFFSLPWLNQLFGVGFGYIRSTDLFSTLLVNVGVVGLIISIAIFFYPVLRLGRSYREIGLKAGLLVVLGAAMVSVPEYSYLSTWLFLGMAYHELQGSPGKELTPPFKSPRHTVIQGAAT